MSDTYLTTTFRDREAVKALGARWDAARKRWYVPAGRDLAPFASWLAASNGNPVAEVSEDLTVSPRGISLSGLLAGVAQAVSQAYRRGVWTLAEVVRADARRGHVMLELAERAPSGDAVAQARALIWADTANEIVPAFEKATGVVLGAGIKLLVRAKPTMHPLYGLSLVIDAIDPDYTLGDLEAKKREIRQRLQREGLFDANRKLPQPWDYTSLLVVAPEGAAGLGDFRAEAERLQRHGVCRFVYVFSRFQGEGAALEIRRALLDALQAWKRTEARLPDAVAIIRGGGAVNDLAWLNSYELARTVCELDVPVLTGIGHERDGTVLDEVANLCFDTPSKVIHGIEQVIARRVAEARANFELVVKTGLHGAQAMRLTLHHADVAIKAGAQRQVAAARERSSALLTEVRVGSLQGVRSASDGAVQTFAALRHLAQEQLSSAKDATPALLAEVRSEARRAVRSARDGGSNAIHAVLERGGRHVELASERLDHASKDVSRGARTAVTEVARTAEALMREIAGQGPSKTLGRGFAIVRTREGRTVTGVGQAGPDQDIEIELRDGTLPARTTIKEEQR